MTGPVRAWRCWAVAAAGRGILCSCLDPNPHVIEWHPGAQPAACAFHDHPAPDPACRCGWRGQPDLAELIWWLRDFKQVTPHVIGGVELSGAVLAGDRAHPEIPGILRAGQVRVTGPLVVGPVVYQTTNVTALAARYGVQAVASSGLDARSWLSAVEGDLHALGAGQERP